MCQGKVFAVSFSLEMHLCIITSYLQTNSYATIWDQFHELFGEPYMIRNATIKKWIVVLIPNKDSWSVFAFFTFLTPWWSCWTFETPCIWRFEILPPSLTKVQKPKKKIKKKKHAFCTRNIKLSSFSNREENFTTNFCIVFFNFIRKLSKVLVEFLKKWAKSSWDFLYICSIIPYFFKYIFLNFINRKFVEF